MIVTPEIMLSCLESLRPSCSMSHVCSIAGSLIGGRAAMDEMFKVAQQQPVK